MARDDDLRKIGFRFARQLTDPAFRIYLRENGCERDVVVALADEPTAAALRRAAFARPPALLAIGSDTDIDQYCMLRDGLPLPMDRSGTVREMWESLQDQRLPLPRQRPSDGIANRTILSQEAES